MFVKTALVFCLLYLNKSEGTVYEDNLIVHNETMDMVEENKRDVGIETVKMRLPVTQSTNREVRITSEDGFVSDMIKTLENVKRNANDMNEKISEQQFNVDKLIEEIDPKEKFVQYLTKKIDHLEERGKILEESLYMSAEDNTGKKAELREMIEQKDKIKLENVKLKNSLSRLVERKGEHSSSTENNVTNRRIQEVNMYPYNKQILINTNN